MRFGEERFYLLHDLGTLSLGREEIEIWSSDDEIVEI
jgi:hypothetical protein